MVPQYNVDSLQHLTPLNSKSLVLDHTVLNCFSKDGRPEASQCLKVHIFYVFH